jgi:two-component system, NarL family, nitrate/nitrite sensor histidine kinase NarX
VNLSDTTASSDINPPRWLVFVWSGFFLLAALLIGSLETRWIRELEAGWRVVYDILVVVMLSVPVGITLFYLRGVINRQARVYARLKVTESLVGEAYQRLGAVLRIREQFLEAESDEEIIELLLRNTVDMTGAAGASFVPLDEHRHPLPAVSYGQPHLSMPDAWLEYLASPAIRSRCSECAKRNRFVNTCPLLKGPFSNAAGLYCLPLRQGEREYGVLNIYVPDPDKLDVETQAFITSLIDETSHALESVWLRRREIDTLNQLRGVRKQSDLNNLLAELLQNVYSILEPDFAILALRETDSPSEALQEQNVPLREEILCGSLPEQAKPYVQATIQKVLSTASPIMMGPTNRATIPQGLRAALAMPLVSEKTALGVLMIGNKRAQRFSPRQIDLLQTVASQLALVVQNANNLAEIEYKAIMAERTRLAREIHDGLAQTLGFLKLQAAQMQSYLERGDIDRLKQGISTYYQTLSEAYQDARYAIDGLRITGSRLDEWLEQVLEEFQDNFDENSFCVSVDCAIDGIDIPSEVQAQLIRIVQEALSNIRKHADATQVFVSCKKAPEGLVLDIRDDGQGFLAEDIPGPSRHGLRGMRERAELIGADFQIISLPQQGTTVRIVLPYRIKEVRG